MSAVPRAIKELIKVLPHTKVKVNMIGLPCSTWEFF